MQKNYIWSIVIIILIALVIIFAQSKKTVAPTNTDNPVVENSADNTMPANRMENGDGTQVSAGIDITVPKKVTVTYTDSGFSPKTITIAQGDSVTFINNSSGGMSVASNPHPSHTIYPEFDQYKTSARGQKEFTFTFDRKGSWGYHNHANSSNTGTVIVQ